MGDLESVFITAPNMMSDIRNSLHPVWAFISLDERWVQGGTEPNSLVATFHSYDFLSPQVAIVGPPYTNMVAASDDEAICIA